MKQDRANTCWLRGSVVAALGLLVCTASCSSTQSTAGGAEAGADATEGADGAGPTGNDAGTGPTGNDATAPDAGGLGVDAAAYQNLPAVMGTPVVDGGAVVGTTGSFTAQGGTMVVASEGVTIAVPAGALPNGGTVTISAPLTSAAPVTGFTTTSPIYSFGPNGQQFAMPVEITLTYSPSAIPAGSSTGDLVLITAPEGTSSYTALPSTVLTNNQVTGVTTHLATSRLGSGWAPWEARAASG